MDRRRSRLVAGAVTLAALLALVVAPGASALDFRQDDPCKDADPAWICPSGVVDAPYSIQYKVSGEGAGPPFSFTMIWGTTPTGTALRSDGVIGGTPTEAGTWTFGVQLWDKAGNKGGDNDFVIKVDPRVLVATQTAAPGTTGVPYSLPLSAVMKSSPTLTSTPTSPLTWSIVSGQLPPGLTLGASDGAISGTPTAEGSYGFTVRAALIDGRADTKSLTIDVRAPVAIAARAAPRSEVGVLYRLPLVASGGSGTYTWSLTSGTLPPGVALGASGVIAGKPNAAGTYRFTATAADTGGRTATYPGAIAVAARLEILPTALRAAHVDRAYRAKLPWGGGVEPRTWRVVRGKLPRGLRLDRKQGVIAGTPRAEGRYLVTLQVRDGLGVTATRTLRLDVTA